MQTFGTLTLLPALEHPELLGETVRASLADWEHAGEVTVAEIDPTLADTAAMTEAYEVSLRGERQLRRGDGQARGAGAHGCLRRPRGHPGRCQQRGPPNPRRAQVPRSSTTTGRSSETGMEYGGITPIGIPADWRLLVDAAVTGIDLAIIGSGIRGSKLFLPGRLLGRLPGAEVIQDLAR